MDVEYRDEMTYLSLTLCLRLILWNVVQYSGNKLLEKACVWGELWPFNIFFYVYVLDPERLKDSEVAARWRYT